MKVRLAKTAGFCMGVRRAMEIVLAEANKNKGPIYTYGPLIHNSQVLDLLESKAVHTLEDISGIQEGTLVIRAHGIPPQQRKLLKASPLRIIDATCPRVARVQAIIRYHTHKGYTAAIVGDRDHPEVIGLMGYGNDRSFVINTPEEAALLPETDRLIVVAQTTQDEKNFREVVHEIKKHYPEALIFDTICDATHSRQDEVKAFAGHVDGVVVVGGFHSGNTRRLVQVAESSGLPSFHVETEEELKREKLASMKVVGVTAGASTPNWMIRNVVKEIESIQSRGESFWRRWVVKGLKILLLSNVVVAFGALSLAYATAVLSERKPDLIHPVLALLYIHAMHVLNRFLDKGASTYNDPERAQFYRRHKILLILSGIVTTLGALFLSYTLGMTVFLAMTGLSILGIIYSIPIVPISRRHLWRYSKIKDIPGSKTLSEALAWGAVIALLPLLEPQSVHPGATLVSFLFVFAVVYTRSALFDIFQVQGDLIVGVETLPITLGEKRTLLFLKGVLITAGIILLAAFLSGLAGPFALLMLLCLGSLSLSLLTYEKRWLYPGTRLEALVEASFFLAGLLALVWNAF
ncbi:MAG: 4-hydroxy-3-methylbut-2-enyl diphosphate reductase [Pseudomonadota bacterium]